MRTKLKNWRWWVLIALMGAAFVCVVSETSDEQAEAWLATFLGVKSAGFGLIFLVCCLYKEWSGKGLIEEIEE